MAHATDDDLRELFLAFHAAAVELARVTSTPPDDYLPELNGWTIRRLANAAREHPAEYATLQEQAATILGLMYGIKAKPVPGLAEGLIPGAMASAMAFLPSLPPDVTTTAGSN